MKRNILFLAAAFSFVSVQGQKIKKEDRPVLENLKQHVVYLSDDRLQGRRTGTDGEKAAAAYISEEFKKAGIQAKGTNGFLQEFTIREGKTIDPKTSLSIEGNNLHVNKDFFPLVYSANVSIEAMPSLSLEESGMPWFLDLKEIIENNAANPHFDLAGAVYQKVKEIQGKGASAVFLYNTTSTADHLKFDPKDRSPLLKIPVIYIQKEAATKYFSDASASLDIKLVNSISEITRTGNNVVGFIDNGAPTTVVLGAHYDHLGFGEDNNSRALGLREIHNGADDNASGTAAMIELAKKVNSSKLKNHNYLFIAFSGEELGLFGSKYFTDNPTIDLNAVSYMINMDMVGRLNDSSKTITVGGYGTSPLWGELYNLKGKKGLYSDGLNFRFDSSGTGPSDHTSFYRKNIPVLFYFTGLHSDYHKPSDDHERINYGGQLSLVKHVYSLLEATSKDPGKLAFQKTREAQTTTSARFSVSLGIMPDYSFSGTGVKADGVSEGRAAQKAGIQAGDVILSIGEYKINSLENYMQALGKFKKGDKTTVTYSRKEKVLSSEVEF